MGSEGLSPPTFGPEGTTLWHLSYNPVLVSVHLHASWRLAYPLPTIPIRGLRPGGSTGFEPAPVVSSDRSLLGY